MNRKAFIRRIKAIIAEYKEENEYNFEREIRQIIAQIEIYDQIWYVREMPKDSKHSTKAIDVIEEVILLFNDISDVCAECFPFEIIDKLKKDFLNE